MSTFNEQILKGMHHLKAYKMLVRNGYKQTFVKEIGPNRARIEYSFVAAGVSLRSFEMLVMNNIVMAVSMADED